MDSLEVGNGCDLGHRLGEVPPGTDARVLDDSCYNSESRIYYYWVAFANESTGWVEEGDIIPAADYTPPPDTETPLSPTETQTPKPTSTPRSTSTPGLLRHLFRRRLLRRQLCQWEAYSQLAIGK